MRKAMTNPSYASRLLVLDFLLSMHQMKCVGLACSRPAIPRHPAQGLHLARSPGRELLVGCAFSQPSSSIGGAS
jgi:hypothetical protein